MQKSFALIFYIISGGIFSVLLCVIKNPEQFSFEGKGKREIMMAATKLKM